MHVHIIGTGLVGASLGMALTRSGCEVTLHDASVTEARLAADLGAGRVPPTGEQLDPDLVVVAVPPDAVAVCVLQALQAWPRAVVTDVASVKGSVIAGLAASGTDLQRYVGSHPMAGRERSGALAARAGIFDGRAWVVVPHPSSAPEAVALVEHVAELVGAAVTTMQVADHDRAVATVSHVPQVLASLVAAQLVDLPEHEISLAGQGVRDVTRIAASDPRLWTQILAANATAVNEVLKRLHAQLGEVVAALDAPQAPGALGTLGRTVETGNHGQARIPGKHGAAPTAYALVQVLVPDSPGELGRLLTEIGEIGVNLEDLRLDHGLDQPMGVAEVSVLPAAADRLRTELTARGWAMAQ